MYKVCYTHEVMSSPPHVIAPIPNGVGSSCYVVSISIYSNAIFFAIVSILLFSFAILDSGPLVMSLLYMFLNGKKGDRFHKSVIIDIMSMYFAEYLIYFESMPTLLTAASP